MNGGETGNASLVKVSVLTINSAPSAVPTTLLWHHSQVRRVPDSLDEGIAVSPVQSEVNFDSAVESAVVVAVACALWNSLPRKNDKVSGCLLQTIACAVRTTGRRLACADCVPGQEC